MYVCMYVYTYVCMYVCKYMYRERVCVNMYICTHEGKHACVCVCVSTHVLCVNTYGLWLTRMSYMRMHTTQFSEDAGEGSSRDGPQGAPVTTALRVSA